MRGSYVLLLELERPAEISVGKRRRCGFRSGFYAYVGSGMRGLKWCEIPLLGDGDQPARYAVRCHFAAVDPPGSQSDPAVFDIKMQGQVVARTVSVSRDAGGTRRALVLAFDDIDVTDKLRMELVPQNNTPPTISGIEVRRVE